MYGSKYVSASPPEKPIFISAKHTAPADDRTGIASCISTEAMLGALPSNQGPVLRWECRALSSTPLADPRNKFSQAPASTMGSRDAGAISVVCTLVFCGDSNANQQKL